jgi:glycosyltransferase involved in cell wall biosynthesis/ADP-heptose:LPS heptosyltransferase
MWSLYQYSLILRVFMRLVIDLQGAQTGSRFRGIGRYSLALAKAIARNRGDNEVIIALSGLFPDTVDSFSGEFDNILPPENIRIWYGIGPTRESGRGNKWRRMVSERLREAFLASLQPDVVLITSLFEGFGDDAIGSIGILDGRIPTAVILYDLIPLLSPDTPFKSSTIRQAWYRRKIGWLRRSSRLLAISESARQEALSTGHFLDNSVVNISAACDDRFRVLAMPEEIKQSLWQRLGINRPFVLYTGGADERKNLHRLIMSYARMPPAIRARHQLVFAGKMPEDYIRAFLKTAKANGLSRSEILITGYVEDEDLIKLYNSCALFVFPSLHEGFGMPPLEAMACGAPVVAANSTSLPEVIGLTEAMFDPKDGAQITAVMTRALTDTEFRKRLIAHGLAQHQKFSWDKSAAAAWTALLNSANVSRVNISPLVRVEGTGLFKQRALRILVIKLDHLGDLILAVPALSKLRARYPYAAIDIIVGSWNVSLAEELGFFSRIVPYDFFRRSSSDAPSTDDQALTHALSQLNTYDIAIDLRRQPDTRFLLIRAIASMKIGYETFDPAMDDFLDVVLESYRDVPFKATPDNETPMAVQLLRIVDSIPGNANDYVTFPQFGISDVRTPGTIAMFPKAGNAAREWNRTNFVELVTLLSRTPDVRSVDIYFASDKDASEFAFESDEKVRLRIGLGFRALLASLSRQSICVANNSGGGHLAAYLGLAVIGVYSGHELPSEWAPQFLDSTVIHRGARCAPCHGARREDCPNGLFCLNDISVADVYAQVMSAIARLGKVLDDSDVSWKEVPDSIVKSLISSIAALNRGEQAQLVEVSSAIARNHPEYSTSTTA